MKLLALRFEEHDSNFSYYDGKNVRYFSTERYFGEKHHGWGERPFDATVDGILMNAFGISVEDVDSICVVTNDYSFGDNLLVKARNSLFTKPTYYIDHHLAHAFSSWPHAKSSVNSFVFDGQGNDLKTHSLFVKGALKNTFHRYHHGSIAERMRTVGRVLRFKGSWQGMEAELDLAGKVMGFQSYGKIIPWLYDHLNNFSIKDVWQVWTFPMKADIEYIDWLRTVHEWTGDTLVKYFSEFQGSKSFSGGTAQNSSFNGKLYKKFDMQFSPTVSDSCLSLGALEILRIKKGIDPFPTDGFPFWQYTDERPDLTDKAQIKKIAELLARGKIVGVYQGRGEVGPRALGNRSILMDPTIKDGKDIINNKVKHRESFRPFGGACLLEDAETYFDAPKETPFMNVNVDVKTKDFPSITHVDNSTRLQTVKDGVFSEILTEFKKLTGYGVLLNTSLNIAGKPIASKAEHAKHIFNTTDLDAIFCGNEAQLK